MKDNTLSMKRGRRAVCVAAIVAIGLSQTLLAAEAETTQGPTKVTVAPGSSSYVNVSSRMMNEVIVPFKNPRVIKFLKPSTRAMVQEDGSSIYVSTADEAFIQLIIKDGDAEGAPGFSVTLMPVEDIPGQHIVLSPVASMKYAGSETGELSLNDYEDMLREYIREAARDQVPSGFTKDANWGGLTLQVGAVVGQSSWRLIGTSFVIEYFVLRNSGASRVELVEPNFKSTGDGVRAIAFTDHHILAPGQTSRMVWIRDR